MKLQFKLIKTVREIFSFISFTHFSLQTLLFHIVELLYAIWFSQQTHSTFIGLIEHSYPFATQWGVTCYNENRWRIRKWKTVPFIPAKSIHTADRVSYRLAVRFMLVERDWDCRNIRTSGVWISVGVYQNTTTVSDTHQQFIYGQFHCPYTTFTPTDATTKWWIKCSRQAYWSKLPRLCGVAGQILVHSNLWSVVKHCRKTTA